MSMLDYPVRLPADVLVALGEFTGQSWSDTLALEPFICDAIFRYVQAVPSQTPESAAPGNGGYQWKEVFLPDGTSLRTSFAGRSLFARVEGEEIKVDGQVVSPSRFANLQGSGNRNAWKVVWLRFTGNQEWILADIYRSMRQEAIARLRQPGSL